MLITESWIYIIQYFLAPGKDLIAEQPFRTQALSYPLIQFKYLDFSRNTVNKSKTIFLNERTVFVCDQFPGTILGLTNTL